MSGASGYTTCSSQYQTSPPRDSVTPLDSLVVAPCSSPLKADTPCTTALTVLQPASHAHAATHAHAPTHATHVSVPMHAHVAATPPEPTYTTLPPITHYSGKLARTPTCTLCGGSCTLVIIEAASLHLLCDFSCAAEARI